MHRRLIRFALVGFSALGVHWLVVVAVVEGNLTTPLRANILAFLVAFQVSYFGHKKLTFAAHDLAHHRALPRFLVVAVGSFLLNQMLFAILLEYAAWPYPLALIFTLLLVAALTFMLSQFWAFRQGRR